MAVETQLRASDGLYNSVCANIISALHVEVLFDRRRRERSLVFSHRMDFGTICLFYFSIIPPSNKGNMYTPSG